MGRRLVNRGAIFTLYDTVSCVSGSVSINFHCRNRSDHMGVARVGLSLNIVPSKSVVVNPIAKIAQTIAYISA